MQNSEETNSNCIYCNEKKHYFLIHIIFKMISCLVWTLSCTVFDSRLKNKLLI